MDTYEPIHVREFRVKAIQRLIIVVREHAQDEINNAALYERHAEERRRDEDETAQRQIMDYQ